MITAGEGEKQQHHGMVITRRRGRRGTKTPVGGRGTGARKQRSAAGARGRESSGRRMGRGGAKTAIGGGGAGARKQLSAAGARAFENTGQRWGRGCAKTPVGGGGSVVPLPPLPLPGGLKTTGRKNKTVINGFKNKKSSYSSA